MRKFIVATTDGNTTDNFGNETDNAQILLITGAKSRAEAIKQYFDSVTSDKDFGVNDIEDNDPPFSEDSLVVYEIK